MQRKWPIRILLSLIITISVLLRFVGIYPGYPPYHPDEGMSYEQGIFMIKEGSLDAHGYNLALAYPNVIPLVNALAFKSVFLPISWSWYYISHVNQVIDGLIKIPLTENDYKRIFQIDILGPYERNVLTWGRVVAAAFGVGVVALTYALSKRMFSTFVGIISSLLIAVNFRQVLNSHLDLPDIYNAFFILFSLIFSYRLMKTRRVLDYLVSGLMVGLSFSVKYQFYSVFPLIIAHIVGGLEQKEKIFDILFSRKFILSFLLAGLTILLINPIHLIRFEDTIYQLTDVSLKYGVGKYQINPYPFWYLYNYGLGKVTTVAIILGMLVMVFRKPKDFAFIFSILASFFYVTTYYTNGGFYTRNFVSITPLLLIFAAYLISQLLILKKTIYKYVGVFVAVVIISLSVYENLSKSIVVALEYTKPWNYTVLSDWIAKNIPAGTKIAAHSSVPLPVDNVVRLPFEQSVAFSVPEFISEGADFSVINFDWETNDFYSWMNRFGIENWGKPIAKLESEYSAMAIRELADFSIYSVVNSWLAPDSSFIISKMPKYKVAEEDLTLDSGIQNVGWSSQPINIGNYKGIKVSSDIKNGYIYANFYSDYPDSSNVTKRVAVRVSAREFGNKNTEMTIISQIPRDAKWMTLGYSGAVIGSSSASKILLYNAKVDADFSGFSVHKTFIEDSLIFPNSHGNL